MNGDLVARSALTRRERAQMCELMRRHYDGVSRTVFEADLANKDWVIRITDDEGEVMALDPIVIIRGGGG